MRPRTAQRLAAAAALAAIMLVMAFLLSWLMGCAPQHIVTTIPPTTTVSGTAAGLIGSVSPDPTTVTPAVRSLWPFTWVGALTLLAGVAWLILFKQPQVLIVGSILAAVPFIVLYTSKAFLIPVAIGVAVIGLVTLGATAGRWLGWWDWSKKGDQAAAKLLKDIKGATNGVETDRIRRTAELMMRVGEPEFDPTKVQTP